ncbi:MAG TPA: hypothetical protein PKK01_06605 [Mycobacterium sp.]|nr:hypothetical protein [Mycobacterium sp.]HPZ93574.1 hypothetical protein [Mycobacterium sp.]HQE14463.1 hypothetical protein [Mycobacterium sp.]
MRVGDGGDLRRGDSGRVSQCIEARDGFADISAPAQIDCGSRRRGHGKAGAKLLLAWCE